MTDSNTIGSDEDSFKDVRGVVVTDTGADCSWDRASANGLCIGEEDRGVVSGSGDEARKVSNCMDVFVVTEALSVAGQCVWEPVVVPLILAICSELVDTVRGATLRSFEHCLADSCTERKVGCPAAVTDSVIYKDV